MAKDELKKVNQRQRLVNQSPAQLKRAGNKQGTVSSTANIDTVDTVGRSNKWSIAGVVIAGVLVATAAGVGSQLKMLTKGNAPQVAPTNTAVNTPSPQAATNPKQEQQGQMFLGQAKLLATQGQPQQLAQAIALTQKVPGGTAVNAEAQSLSTTWSQQIMEQARGEANAGKIPEAIAMANLIPANSPQHQQAQQQVQQWQQAQAQAQDQQFASALAEASRPIPLPAPVVTPEPAPAPVTTTPVAVAPTPAPAVTPQTQPQTQPAPAVATAPQQQAAGVKRPADDGKQAQALANDPYLNVKIPQANTTQVQSSTISSSAVALNSTRGFTANSYGFGNMVAKAPTVAIQLRDNVDEDGDFVSLIVNGEVITRNEMIYNHGKVFMVDLLPGDNTVEIDGLKDGGGGITLEVNVAGVGNVNETPIPEGSTASFIINREQ
ncbi:MAG: hypothetical protein AAGE84_21710 [Cyanobacteria bacterium P01_G01_bin.39]